ncbi:hypothetical protein [Chitinimonas lacunae]|uniref:Uncharacterized protein n=1 Tax=Chitinimonas lacunae TaxID=1963018 RepID=A0ABV8MIE1_9NEIS
MERKHPAVVMALSEHNWALLLLPPVPRDPPDNDETSDPVFHGIHTYRASSRRRHDHPAMLVWPEE